MLVLTRRRGQKVLLFVRDAIGGKVEIEVQVNSVDRGNVQIGFTAPACVEIQREERHQRNQGDSP